MPQGLDGFGLFLGIQTMQEIRHERAGLELLRVQQPMAHPAGAGGIVMGKQNGRRAPLEAPALILTGGMAGDAVQLGDEHFPGGHLLRRRIARESLKAGNHRLRHREEREAQCDDRREAHQA